MVARIRLGQSDLFFFSFLFFILFFEDLVTLFPFFLLLFFLTSLLRAHIRLWLYIPFPLFASSLLFHSALINSPREGLP